MEEKFFGFKCHVIADAHTQIPLQAVLRPANQNEGPWLRKDLDALLERQPGLKPKYLTDDKAYDALYNFQHVISRGMTPIIAVRRPTEDENGRRTYDGTYDEDGRPLCIGGQSMKYLGTDQDGAHHFRCPEEGCHLKNKIDWSRYCDTEYPEKPEGKLLRIMGTVPRFAPLWKEIFNKRGGVERYNSSGKRSRLLDKHQHRGIGRVKLHVTMSMLASQLTALAHLKADDADNVRKMRLKLPRLEQQVKPD